MSEDTPEIETVEVPRLTLASAIDLLADYQMEMERADAAGRYSDELSGTIQRLKDDLYDDGNGS